jgi:hypothetical protein
MPKGDRGVKQLTWKNHMKLAISLPILWPLMALSALTYAADEILESTLNWLMSWVRK